MPHKPTRRGLLKTTATVAVTSALALNRGAAAWAKEPADATAGTLPKVDAVLRAAVSAQDVPGLVAMAATETGVVYEGVFGSRRIHEGTWWALVGMSIAAMGFYGSKGPFFAMPPMFLSGAGLAAGIAWINSIGNLGGFFGPWCVGVMKDLTGSYAGGLYGLALLGLVAAIVCALFLHIPSRTSSAAAPPIGAAAG